MDNLAHSLAGAALGQAGLKTVSGLGMAALVIGANLPDVDVLVILTGGETLTARRGWTHGPIAMLVLPALLTLALVAFDNLQLRRGTRPPDRTTVRPAQLFALALLGCLTHPLLDLMNTYGVRLLMPFSERWFYGDALPIIDVWIWIVLGLGALLSRRRFRARLRRRERPARIAVVAVAAYIAVMLLASHRARQLALRELEVTRGTRAARVLAAPVFINPAHRQLVYDLGDRYRFGSVDWLPRPAVRVRLDDLPTNLEHPLARAASNHADIRAFLYWSRFPFFVLPHDSTAGTVEVGDARFYTPQGVRRNLFRRRVNIGELRPPEPRVSTSGVAGRDPPRAP